MAAQKKTRLDLDRELREVLGSDNVYFSPPESIKLKYPCIVYHQTGGDTKKADNKNYTLTLQYTVTLICKDADAGAMAGYNEETGELDYDSDSFIEKMIYHFPMCNYVNHRAVNNLNHETFTLFY